MADARREQGEWLETDGLGGFASGTCDLHRTRRYHGLLVAAATPPTGRMMLVSGIDAWLVRGDVRVALTSQRYAPDTVYPDGASHIVSFQPEPWPAWTLRPADGLIVEQDLFLVHDSPTIVLRWRVQGLPGPARLEIRPLVAGRDYHSLMHENDVFDFRSIVAGARVEWRPYPGVPAIVAASSGAWRDEACWYHRFLYTLERERGLDAVEDLASPGVFDIVLDGNGEAVLIFSADASQSLPGDPREVTTLAAHLADTERARRAAFPTPLDRAADAYVVARGSGRTIVAGYPWFTDWGRDTFIALRGLSLASGGFDRTRDILLTWSGTVSEGMLPNRFPDAGEAPEFNSVDASLWFVVAAGELQRHARDRGVSLPAGEWTRLRRAIDAVLDGYAHGTRHGIHADVDGLLAAGMPGVQLTWMDAKVGDRVITPRIGKPVEVQALWLNALWVGSQWSATWRSLFDKGWVAFEPRFWNAAGYLNDVVDVDHRPGEIDASVRPNQILAVGGLPLALVTGQRARLVVDLVERALLTPLGLRSLSPEDGRYRGHYGGDAAARDAAYHQGTVWPWLMGPFVEAWLRVRGDTPAIRAEARGRFLAPLFAHLGQAGLGHVSEIADGDPPFTPRGCPFQAWSLGELIRMDCSVLATPGDAIAAASPTPRMREF